MATKSHRDVAYAGHLLLPFVVTVYLLLELLVLLGMLSRDDAGGLVMGATLFVMFSPLLVVALVLPLAGLWASVSVVKTDPNPLALWGLLLLTALCATLSELSATIAFVGYLGFAGFGAMRWFLVERWRVRA